MTGKNGLKKLYLAIFILTVFLTSTFSCIEDSFIQTDIGLPSISSLNPDSGYIGSVVRIEGTNFTSDYVRDSIYFNGVPALIIDGSITHRTVQVPQGSTTGPVSVRIGGKQAVGSDFKVILPMITVVEPDSGIIGATVRIEGVNFNADFSADTVYFNGVPARIVDGSATHRSVIILPGATTGPVSLFTNGASVNGPVFKVILPVISAVLPDSGYIGSSVRIEGINFAADFSADTVFINGIPAAGIIDGSATHRTAKVPLGASSGPVGLFTNGTKVTGPSFKVILPEIMALHPDSGAIGSLIRIEGINFAADFSADTVFINGIPTAGIIDGSVTHRTVEVPLGVSSGPVGLFTNGTKVTGPSFKVLLPLITALQPDSGAIGTAIQIEGANFAADPSSDTIFFNGIPGFITAGTATSRTVTVPVGATTGPVSLFTNGTNVTGPVFKVTLPVITALLPSSGIAGTQVRIEGKNFATDILSDSVLFNGVSAVIIDGSTTHRTVSVPVGATTGSVGLYTSGVKVMGPTFTVLTPAITSLAPTIGEIGAVVRINGINFGTAFSQDKVFFNGVQATITGGTDTYRDVIVPVGATTGILELHNGGAVLTGPIFTVLLPTITSITPTSGLVGSLITINGLYFSTNILSDKVFINGIPAAIISGTTTQRVVRVLQGTTSGPVSLTTNSSTAIGPVFTVIIPAVSTYAGTGVAGYLNGAKLSAELGELTMLGRDLSGQILFSEGGVNGHRLRIVDAKNNVALYAGTGVAGLLNGSPLSAVQFNKPAGHFLDTKNSLLYVVDNGNNVVRVINAAGSTATYAGGSGGTTAGYAEGDRQKIALFNSPMDVVVDSKGNVYVSDGDNHSIRKIDPVTGIVSTFAGNGTPGFVNGKGTAARFNWPMGICIDAMDNIYVADVINNAIRKIDPGGLVTTVAGTGTSGLVNGTAAVAQFNFPTDVDIDNLGNLYISDYNNHMVRILETDGQVKTYAGTGVAGFLDGSADKAQFNNPFSIMVLNSNNLLLTDYSNYRIRLITR